MKLPEIKMKPFLNNLVITCNNEFPYIGIIPGKKIVKPETLCNMVSGFAFTESEPDSYDLINKGRIFYIISNLKGFSGFRLICSTSYNQHRDLKIRLFTSLDIENELFLTSKKFFPAECNIKKQVQDTNYFLQELKNYQITEEQKELIKEFIFPNFPNCQQQKNSFSLIELRVKKAKNMFDILKAYTYYIQCLKPIRSNNFETNEQTRFRSNFFGVNNRLLHKLITHIHFLMKRG